MIIYDLFSYKMFDQNEIGIYSVDFTDLNVKCCYKQQYYDRIRLKTYCIWSNFNWMNVLKDREPQYKKKSEQKDIWLHDGSIECSQK